MLEHHPLVTSSRESESVRFSLGNEEKEEDLNKGSPQMESKIEHSQWSTSVQDQLLGNICTSGHVDFDLSPLLECCKRQIDFILAYPQAPLEMPLFMEVPKGFSMPALPGRTQDYVLELKKNLYRQKQAGQVWYQHLAKG